MAKKLTDNQFKNILAFVMLVSDESPGVLNLAPGYIEEKYWRQFDTPPPDDHFWQTGLHPMLRRLFDDYCRHWRIFTPYPHQHRSDV